MRLIMHALLSTLGLRINFNDCCIYEEEFRLYEEKECDWIVKQMAQ